MKLIIYVIRREANYKRVFEEALAQGIQTLLHYSRVEWLPLPALQGLQVHRELGGVHRIESPLHWGEWFRENRG